MQVSVTEAKGQLTELVRRAEAGDEIILTRHGQPAVRLVPVKPALDRRGRGKLIAAVRASAALKSSAGPNAASSQDSLYDEDGLPSDAKEHSCSLLLTGNDFSRTDVQRAPHP
jgi:prevent-host-death family protein